LREPTIARNYAEALFDSGEKSGDVEQYADLLEAIAGVIHTDDHIRAVLESPRVPKVQKQQLLSGALAGKAPEPFIRFLSAIIKRGRQGMIGGIAREFLNLVDIKMDRVHASVVVAREPDTRLQKEVAKRLSELVGLTVIPHFRHEPSILGGVIVRIGDRVMDGSLRRKMLLLRRKMLGA
jgi:F-type H+-transporting ATPase subunit delta